MEKASCRICKKELSSKYLSTHIKRVHMERKHKCDICEICFVSKSGLDKHVKGVHQEYQDQEYQKKVPMLRSCKDCDFWTFNKTALNNHYKRAHNRNLLKCDMCNFESKTHRIHLRHKIIAHGLKAKFNCESCNFVTYEKKDLQVHINRKHLKLKPYKCEVCDFRSTTWGTVTKHQRQVHLKLKPFPCQECDYRAFTRTLLKGHVNSKHTKEEHKMKFVCNICQTVLTTKSALTTHKRCLHSDASKELQCQFCNYKIRGDNPSKYLENHMTRNHPREFN